LSLNKPDFKYTENIIEKKSIEWYFWKRQVLQHQNISPAPIGNTRQRETKTVRLKQFKILNGALKKERGGAILFLAIGVLQRDGRFVLLGYMTLVLTVLYFAFLLLGRIAVPQGMIEWFPIG
jgi:hypothetical protein